MKKSLTFIIFFIAIFLVYFFLVRYFLPGWAESSQFGDMFGGLNTFFSGLAFLGIIYTIFLQREELHLQRKELELTRKELKRTAEAQEKSEEALSRQATSLKITAKLNGLSSQLQHFGTLILHTNSSKFGIDHVEYGKRKKDADDIIVEIKRLIEDN